MKALTKIILLPLLLVALAAGLRFWAAPFISRLPDDYTSEMYFNVTDRFRTELNEGWVAESFNAQRVDQALSATQDVVIIQSSLNWYNAAGEVIFLSSGIYGVDRRTYANQGGYGDAERSGQFMPSPGMPPGGYTLWDAMYAGPRALTFKQAGTLDGLPVNIYEFTVSGLDETAGYAYLPDVPERYQARTNATGTLWVEPVSGVVLNYEERGTSYFIDPASAENQGDFHTWTDEFTAETRASQVRRAADLRQRVLLLTTWLPPVLLFCALFWLMSVLYTQTSQRARSLS